MKVIQVGMGGMGRTWLSAVQRSTEVQHAGFVEINDAVAKEMADSFGLNPALIYHSLDEALAAVQADGVIDVTPPQFHKTVSLAALEAGLPVLSEKPLADTLESAREIVRKADETGVLHMVAQNRRYSVPAQTLKSVLASGEMGAVSSVSVEFYRGPHFGGFREEMAYPLIIDMAIHHFDMMRFFLDSDVVSVFGRSWNPAWSWYKGDASASVVFDFANGAVVSYDASWCSMGAETSWNAHWRFECANGAVVMQQDEVSTARHDAPPTPVAIVQMPHADQSYLLHEFYEAVTAGKTPATTCQDNLKSLAMVFDTVRSFESGGVV
jgi:predicted dehydrogenase